jgi:undecaprenyl-diphosphatase
MLGFIFPLFQIKYRILKVTAISVGIIVALSRVYLGVHYPSDVLIGAAIGLIIGWSMNHFLYSRLKIKEK